MDDEERRRLGVIVPAKPKSVNDPLGDVLSKRATNKAQIAARLAFITEQPEIVDPDNVHREVAEQAIELGKPWIKPDDRNAFHSFALILKTLQKYPQQTQREMIELLTTLLLT